MTWWIHELEEPAAAPAELEAEPVLEEPELEQLPAELEQPAPAAPPAPAPPAAAAPRPRSRVRVNTYTLVFGKKGAGKTSFARSVFAQRVRAGGSAVFVDPTLCNGDLAEVCTSVGQFDRMWRPLVRAGRPFAAVIQPGWDDDFNKLWRLIYQIGDLLLVIDETDRYATAQRIDPNLEKLVNLGRNQQVDILTTVRTPPELSKRIQGNVDVAISFKQELPDYAQDLNRRFFRLPDGEARILALPPLHYLRVQNGRVSAGVVHHPHAAP